MARDKSNAIRLLLVEDGLGLVLAFNPMVYIHPALAVYTLAERLLWHQRTNDLADGEELFV